ncbi:MAG: phosphoribosylanthranilate isomerase [Porticoccaceae bacterium]
MKTRIKICGITRVEDGINAVRAGADAVGFVFYPASPRYIDPARARDIVCALGPLVTTVALFVNESAGRVATILAQTGIQLLQFHGDEDAAYCDQFQRPYIKAIRMAPGLDPQAEIACFPDALGYLFDAWRADQYGGTGEVFDWRRLAGANGSALILAGGLTPDNVAEAIKIARPGAVDVSGGVESAPGVKDRGMIERFVAAVHSAESGFGSG